MTKEQELLELMKGCKLNQETIEGVMILVKEFQVADRVINFIQSTKQTITDHQLRKYMEELILRRRG